MEKIKGAFRIIPSMDYGVILFTFVLFIIMISVIFRTASDVIKQSVLDAEYVNIRAMPTIGAEWQFPGTKELRLVSHNFSDKTTWENPECGEFIWKPPPGKVWVISGFIFLIDGDIKYQTYVDFKYFISGEVMVERKYYKLLDSAVYADDMDSFIYTGKPYLVFRFNYTLPYLLKSSRNDYVRIYPNNNIPVGGTLCKATALIIERDEKTLD